jgi:transcriptional regulator
MYVPAPFRVEDPVALLAELLRSEPATIVTTTPGGLEATIVPLVLDADRGANGTLLGHVARPNRHALDGDGAPALVTVMGVEGYISPSWYPSKGEHGKVVPTWDYVAVQVNGTLRMVDDARWLRDQVERLSDRHEAGRPEPWGVDNAPPSFLDKMIGGIVGIEIEIDRIVAKAKLSQNRPAADLAGVVAGLRAGEADGAALAAAVARPPETRGVAR